ncbi:MAG: DUF6090 family protein [Flavobacteriales bacterium]
MLKSLRNNLRPEHRLFRVLRNGVGEVLMVMVGILLALQVNNWNDGRKEGVRERVFLRGIRTDLELNIVELDTKITYTENALRSANVMITYFEGTPVMDLDSFNFHTIEVLALYTFHRNNSTFKEMISSGNLGILTDDTLKRELLDMERTYDQVDGYQEHIRYDYEQFLYDRYFRIADVGVNFKNYAAQKGWSEGKAGSMALVDAEVLLQDRAYKNGFALSILNNNDLVEILRTVRSTAVRSIERIDRQLKN